MQPATELMQRRFDRTIKPIKTERDRQKGLKDIEKLWDAKPGTAARPGRRFGYVGGGLRTESTRSNFVRSRANPRRTKPGLGDAESEEKS